MSTTITPRCPHCNAHGIDQLAHRPVDSYLLVFCGQCGAIFGVAPCPDQSPPEIKPEGRTIPARYDGLSVADLRQALSEFIGQDVARLSAKVIASLFINAKTEDDNPPVCTEHGQSMVKLTVPDGFPQAGQMFWVCNNFRACGQWQRAAQNTVARRAGRQVKKQSPRSVSPALNEAGQVDLSKRVPYSPELAAARMRAASGGRSTQYMRIALDDGPPICLTHKVDMVCIAIPAGYKNAGRKIWICPKKTCDQWELAG